MADAAVETNTTDDIRSALGAAFAEHENEAAPAPAPAAKETVAAEAPEPAADERAASAGTERGPDGKFVKKAQTETEAPAETADKEATTTEEAAPETETAAAPAPEFQKALAAWKPADQAMFKKLPAESQEFMMRRYKEMEGDYTKKLQGVARLKSEYEPVDRMLEPHREQMKARGFTAASLVEAWGNVEKRLVAGEDSAVEVLHGLVRGYNIPVAKLARALGIAAQTAAAPAARQNAEGEADAAAPTAMHLPPEVINEINTLKQQVSGLTNYQAQAAANARNAAAERTMREIEQFKSTVDDKGTLLRPHFGDVENDMVRLANAAVASRQPVPPLQELYETAVWANPSTREKLLAAQQQAAEQKRIDQDKQKAAAARKAAVSVTGAPGAGQAPQVRNTPERSLRDELEANAAELSAA